MTGRRDWRAATIAAALVALLGGSIGFALVSWTAGGATASPRPASTATSTATPSPTPRPTPTPPPPAVTITHETCCTQAARVLDLAWSSDVAVRSATAALTPEPPFECTATLDRDGQHGRLGCAGLLAGATDYVATLTLTTADGSDRTAHRFRTMGDRLEGVPWFTEFEDLTGPPLACAAASVRMIQLFATGEDKLTASQILSLGAEFNRSNDPGLDPAAIATMLKQLDPQNDYHYYVFPTREEATNAAVHWLLRSGKPVISITLAGQHAPLVIGFTGPANAITGVIVQDPQRGDLRPETNRRPDIYRAQTFQTGHTVGLEEWYRHEWWLGYGYWWTNRAGVGMDRSDGAYPTPHWSGKFVILVDDGDSDHPSDQIGRVRT